MDLTLPSEQLRLLENLDRYFSDFPTSCPYDLPEIAIYRMARFSMIPEKIMHTLLAAGYRRYGDTVYTMRCPGCRKCQPIRIDPEEFRANRSQKRALRANTDLEINTTPLAATDDNVRLLQHFFDTRFPGRNNLARDYYAGFFLNSSQFSFEIRYSVKGRLIGVSIVDCGKTWLNAVYFFFDPAEARRSPGTFNILNLIDICRRNRIRELYLGYMIEEVHAMCYKAAFRPHYLLKNGSWQKSDTGE
ncbi:MAG: arginyltransferase [Proteobacteria bacterium]|nr:arginyltransferase [Pseudomonadota bacterium]MBU1736993.1 arginyltransferase [Pseudomonadota bacterium]